MGNVGAMTMVAEVVGIARVHFPKSDIAPAPPTAKLGGKRAG